MADEIQEMNDDPLAEAARTAFQEATATGASPEATFDAAVEAAKAVATEMGMPSEEFQQGLQAASEAFHGVLNDGAMAEDVFRSAEDVTGGDGVEAPVSDFEPSINNLDSTFQAEGGGDAAINAPASDFEASVNDASFQFQAEGGDTQSFEEIKVTFDPSQPPDGADAGGTSSEPVINVADLSFEAEGGDGNSFEEIPWTFEGDLPDSGESHPSAAEQAMDEHLALQQGDAGDGGVMADHGDMMPQSCSEECTCDDENHPDPGADVV